MKNLQFFSLIIIMVWVLMVSQTIKAQDIALPAPDIPRRRLEKKKVLASIFGKT